METVFHESRGLFLKKYQKIFCLPAFWKPEQKVFSTFAKTNCRLEEIAFFMSTGMCRQCNFFLALIKILSISGVCANFSTFDRNLWLSFQNQILPCPEETFSIFKSFLIFGQRKHFSTVIETQFTFAVEFFDEKCFLLMTLFFLN